MAFLDKPRLVEKFKAFRKYVKNNNGQIGTAPRVLEINFNNLCNFRCKHCNTNANTHEGIEYEMTLETIADIADQADKLGMFEMDLQGGELLMRKEKLYDVLRAIRSERFYQYLTTNGWLLTQDIAYKKLE